MYFIISYFCSNCYIFFIVLNTHLPTFIIKNSYFHSLFVIFWKKILFFYSGSNYRYGCIFFLTGSLLYTSQFLFNLLSVSLNLYLIETDLFTLTIIIDTYIVPTVYSNTLVVAFIISYNTSKLEIICYITMLEMNKGLTSIVALATIHSVPNV